MLKFFKKIEENKLYKATFGKINGNTEKQLIYEKVKEDIENLRDASEKLKNNKEFILDILKDKKAYLQSGGEESDGEPVDEKHVIVLNKVSDRLKNDKEVIMRVFNNPIDCYYNYEDSNVYNAEKISTQLLGNEIKSEYFKDKGEITRAELIETIEEAIQKENARKEILEKVKKMECN